MKKRLLITCTYFCFFCFFPPTSWCPQILLSFSFCVNSFLWSKSLREGLLMTNPFSFPLSKHVFIYFLHLIVLMNVWYTVDGYIFSTLKNFVQLSSNFPLASMAKKTAVIRISIHLQVLHLFSLTAFRSFLCLLF